jgi:dienelactone hydrolase
MNANPVIVLACFLLSAASQPLYEEDLLSSSGIRVEQWKQMEAYIAALSGKKPDGALESLVHPESAAALRESFRMSIGYPPPGFDTIPAGRSQKIGEDGQAIYHRCFIRVTPEMETYGLYIVPRKRQAQAPLVIAKHGGGGYPELATFQGGANYHDMVRGAVAEGYIVYVPLTIMYPYRDRDHGTPIPAEVRAQLDRQLRNKGTSLMAVEAFKITRALDVLLKRPEIDPTRVGMIGLSYGGFYTLYTAALDPRIGVAIASCSFRYNGPTGAARKEKPAGRPDDLSSVELVRLISPRPLQVQNGIRDKGFPIDDVRQAVEKSRPWYSGPSADRFDFEAFDGVHEFRGDVAWPFLRKHLARK